MLEAAVDHQHVLAGVVATTTGLPAHDKAAVQREVEAAGGLCSPNLSKRTTHLIVPEAVRCPTDKLSAACDGGGTRFPTLHIVRRAWASAAAAAAASSAGGARAAARPDEREFAPLLPSALQRPDAAATSAPGSTGAAAAPQTPWVVHMSQLADESVWGPPPGAAASSSDGRQLAQQLHLQLSPISEGDQLPRRQGLARHRKQQAQQQVQQQPEGPDVNTGAASRLLLHAAPHQAHWQLGGQQQQQQAPPASSTAAAAAATEGRGLVHHGLPQLLQQIHQALQPEGSSSSASAGIAAAPAATAADGGQQDGPVSTPRSGWHSWESRVSAPGGLAGQGPGQQQQLPPSSAISCPGIAPPQPEQTAACQDREAAARQPQPARRGSGGGTVMARLLAGHSATPQTGAAHPGAAGVHDGAAGSAPRQTHQPDQQQQQQQPPATAAASPLLPRAATGSSGLADTSSLDALLSALRRATGERTAGGTGGTRAATLSGGVQAAAAVATAPPPQLQLLLPGSSAHGKADVCPTGGPTQHRLAPVDLTDLLGRLRRPAAALPQHISQAEGGGELARQQSGAGAGAGAGAAHGALDAAAAVAEAAELPLPASQEVAPQRACQQSARKARALPPPAPDTHPDGGSSSVADLIAALRRATGDSRRNTSEAAAWAVDAAGGAEAADAHPRGARPGVVHDTQGANGAATTARRSSTGGSKGLTRSSSTLPRTPPAAADTLPASQPRHSVEQLLAALQSTSAHCQQHQEQPGAPAAAAEGGLEWGSSAGGGQTISIQDRLAAKQEVAAPVLPWTQPPQRHHEHEQQHHHHYAQQQQPVGAGGLEDVRELVAELQRVTRDSPGMLHEQPSAGAVGSTPQRAAPAPILLADTAAGCHPSSVPDTPVAACSPGSSPRGTPGAGTPAPACAAKCSSRAGSQPHGELLLTGLAVVFHASVPQSTQEALTQALTRCGGVVVPGPPHLGCAANTIVAEPDAAGHCLPLLLDVVSPSWLARACRQQHQQQHLVSVSPDIARALASQQQQQRHPVSDETSSSGVGGHQHAPATRDGDAVVAAGAAAMDGSAGKQQEQQEQLQQHPQEGVLDAAASISEVAVVLQQQQLMPASLLTDLVWSVDQSPASCIADEELDAVVLQCPTLSGSITLLLPQHSSAGALGHEAVVCAAGDPGRGLTVRDCCACIHAHYMQSVRLQPLSSSSSRPGEVVVVPRTALLGHKKLWDGLRRVCASPCSSVFELCLRV